MSQIIDIPGQGEVEFPDGMSDSDITAAIKKITGPKVGAGQAFESGAQQGATFGFWDEIRGLQRGIASSPTARLLLGSNPQDKAEARAREASGLGDSFLEAYRRKRDQLRETDQAAREQHKWADVGGQLAGAGLTTLATAGLGGGAQAARGVPLAARLLQGAKVGAAAGGLYGAGASEAETIPGMAGDVATGAAFGGAAGGVLPAVGAAVKKAASPLADWLQRRAVESGRKALSGIGAPLSARAEIPEAVVNQALDTGAVRPFGTVTGAAKRLEEQTQLLGDSYGKILQELEAQGVTGPNAVTLAQQITQRAKDAARTSLGSARPRMLSEMAAELPTKVDPTPFASKRLGLGQAEEIKRGLQSEARREYDKITRQMTTAGETKKEMASIMRQAIEDEIAAQAEKAPEAAARFLPVKERLANALRGLSVAEEGAARAARRAPPSVVPPLVVGSVTGQPGLGLLTLLGRLGDRRVSSTVARAARGGAKALGAVSQAAPSSAQQAQAEEVAALIAALQRPRLPMGLTPVAAQGDEQ